MKLQLITLALVLLFSVSCSKPEDDYGTGTDSYYRSFIHNSTPYSGILIPTHDTRPTIEQARYEIIIGWHSDNRSLASEDLYTNNFTYNNTSPILQFFRINEYWECSNPQNRLGNFMEWDYNWYLINQYLYLPAYTKGVAGVYITAVHDRIAKTTIYNFSDNYIITLDSVSTTGGNMTIIKGRQND